MILASIVLMINKYCYPHKVIPFRRDLGVKQFNLKLGPASSLTRKGTTYSNTVLCKPYSQITADFECKEFNLGFHQSIWDSSPHRIWEAWKSTNNIRAPPNLEVTNRSFFFNWNLHQTLFCLNAWSNHVVLQTWSIILWYMCPLNLFLAASGAGCYQPAAMRTPRWEPPPHHHPPTLP